VECQFLVVRVTGTRSTTYQPPSLNREQVFCVPKLAVEFFKLWRTRDNNAPENPTSPARRNYWRSHCTGAFGRKISIGDDFFNFSREVLLYRLDRLATSHAIFLCGSPAYLIWPLIAKVSAAACR